MPAKSKSQQRLFGMVHAYQKGKLKDAPESVKEIARSISDEDAEHFAKTKHRGLPEKKANMHGFMNKCADSDLKRQLLKLLKIKDEPDSFYDRHPVLAPAVSGFAGYKLVSDPRSLSEFTGTEHLFHGTLKDNIPSILEKGLLVSKSLDPKTVSNRAGLGRFAEGHVFAGRTMKPVNQMGMIQQLIKEFKNNDGLRAHFDSLSKLKRLKLQLQLLLGLYPTKDVGTVKIRIPYEDMSRLEPGIDPEWTRTLDELKKDKAGTARKFFTKFMARGYGPNHTVAFSKDIAPEYIKGSSKFRHGLLAELKGMPSYALRHPGRFLAGAGKLGAGAGLLGLTGYNIYRKLRNRRK